MGTAAFIPRETDPWSSFAVEATRVFCGKQSYVCCKCLFPFPQQGGGRRESACALVRLHQVPLPSPHPALPLLLHALPPLEGERKGAGERQLISKHLFHSNSFIFGNATLRLQTAQVADGAKTLSWACYQLEGYHRTLAHQGGRNIGIATLGQTDASSSSASASDSDQRQMLQGKAQNTHHALNSIVLYTEESFTLSPAGVLKRTDFKDVEILLQPTLLQTQLNDWKQAPQSWAWAELLEKVQNWRWNFSKLSRASPNPLPVTLVLAPMGDLGSRVRRLSKNCGFSKTWQTWSSFGVREVTEAFDFLTDQSKFLL